jgi:hypothetical protein
MIRRYGILDAVERAVKRKSETYGYTTLLEMGLDEYAFEAVVVLYSASFSSEAVLHSQQRITALNGGN